MVLVLRRIRYPGAVRPGVRGCVGYVSHVDEPEEVVYIDGCWDSEDAAEAAAERPDVIECAATRCDRNIRVSHIAKKVPWYGVLSAIHWEIKYFGNVALKMICYKDAIWPKWQEGIFDAIGNKEPEIAVAEVAAIVDRHLVFVGEEVFDSNSSRL